VARVLESIQTVNSLMRTLLGAALVCGAGLAGLWGYRAHQAGTLELQRKTEEVASYRRELDLLNGDLARKKEELARQSQKIAGLQEDIREREQRIARLDAAMRLLTVDHRVARLTVADQTRDPATARLRSRVQFVELDERGEPLDVPREFLIDGDVVFVDSWVVKFDDHYVREADLLRGTSLVLFRRLFGEHQMPEQGFALDEVGVRPRNYRTAAAPTDFEKRIWSDFWTIADDPAQAERLGIRAAHGEAPSIRVRKGKSYLLLLRSSDGLSIRPEDNRNAAAEPAT
jgi:uncharacterized coiled-coil protein SlyX